MTLLKNEEFVCVCVFKLGEEAKRKKGQKCYGSWLKPNAEIEKANLLFSKVKRALNA